MVRKPDIDRDRDRLTSILAFEPDVAKERPGPDTEMLSPAFHALFQALDQITDLTDRTKQCTAHDASLGVMSLGKGY
ncbi:hypothetical protein D9M73_197810 [compost metagenome]